MVRPVYRDKWCEEQTRQKMIGVTYCDMVDKFDTIWYYCVGVIK